MVSGLVEVWLPPSGNQQVHISLSLSYLLVHLRAASLFWGHKSLFKRAFFTATCPLMPPKLKKPAAKQPAAKELATTGLTSTTSAARALPSSAGPFTSSGAAWKYLPSFKKKAQVSPIIPPPELPSAVVEGVPLKWQLGEPLGPALSLSSTDMLKMVSTMGNRYYQHVQTTQTCSSFPLSFREFISETNNMFVISSHHRDISQLRKTLR